jgi:hypothetical protein
VSSRAFQAVKKFHLPRPTLQVVGMAAWRNVREGVIPASGYWIMEENPTATISMAQTFVDANIAALKPSSYGQAGHIHRGARNPA